MLYPHTYRLFGLFSVSVYCLADDGRTLRDEPTDRLTQIRGQLTHYPGRNSVYLHKQ